MEGEEPGEEEEDEGGPSNTRVATLRPHFPGTRRYDNICLFWPTGEEDEEEGGPDKTRVATLRPLFPGRAGYDRIALFCEGRGLQ